MSWSKSSEAQSWYEILLPKGEKPNIYKLLCIIFRENMFLVSSEDKTEQSILMQIKRSMGFRHKSRANIAIQRETLQMHGHSLPTSKCYFKKTYKKSRIQETLTLSTYPTFFGGGVKWSCDLRANERPKKTAYDGANRQTDRQTDRHLDIATLWLTLPRGPSQWKYSLIWLSYISNFFLAWPSEIFPFFPVT